MDWGAVAGAIGVVSGLVGVVYAHRANGTADEALELASVADKREAQRLAIELEHRAVSWELRYADGREDALQLTQIGSTPALDTLVTVRANGWRLRRQEVGRVEPDDVVIVDLAAEHAEYEASRPPGQPGLMGWSVKVEWRSPAGKPDSWQYARPTLEL